MGDGDTMLVEHAQHSALDEAATVGRVVIVSPSFFGYEGDIAEAFRAEGASVDLIDERPNNSSAMRGALRIGLRGTDRLVDRHFRRIIVGLGATPVDLLLVIKGESTPAWFLQEMRRLHPSIRIVYYSYDRIRDGDNCLALVPLCDESYSFDPADVERHGLRYKPLFHGPAFHSDEGARTIDVSFVGTAHSDRYRYATGIASAVERSSVFLYSQARWYFALQKYFGRLKGVPWKAVSFDKKSKDDVASTFRRSRAVIDLQRDGQTGLTMRSFEVLASGARLITTNPEILRLEGVDPSAVLVVPVDEVDRYHDRIRRFVDEPGLPKSTGDRYALSMWVRGFLRSVSD